MIGDLKLYLGLEIEKGKNSYFMSQSKYINDLLIRYNMTNCKPSNKGSIPSVTPRSCSNFDY